MSVCVYRVEKGSPADKAGIKAGDVLVSINGNEIADVLDYRFWQLDSKLVLCIESGGKRKSVRIKKEEYEELGMLFETYLMDRQHSCKNKCVFCFVDQLPEKMRSSLYFKDDDTRLSFLFGNYVTLTNISQHEIDRIIKLHISPINVSVHTTNPELRVKMMKNPSAGESLSILKKFADAGISLNCQLVLCPGINDGAELERSLSDLSQLADGIESIALVPVGLTKYREKLFPLTPYTEKGAATVIKTADKFGKALKKKTGSRKVYCSDEFFIKAGLELPDKDYYEQFDQLDNGVGLITDMHSRIGELLEEAVRSDRRLSLSFATGVDAAPFLRSELKRLKGVFTGLEAKVYEVKNDFFGHNITVAGLVTAGDIMNQLKGLPLGSALVLPDVMLRHEKDKFLDDYTADDVSKALGVPVVISKADGDGLYETVNKLINEGGM